MGIKLTLSQKPIIKMMQQGGELSRFLKCSKYVVSIRPTVQLGDRFIMMQPITLNKLIEMGLIIKMDKKAANPHIPELFYELTELGKTISL